MKFKGTKGRWVAGQTNLFKGGRSLVVSPGEQSKTEKGYRSICCVTPIDDMDDEDLANALLISKAPELLNMLIDIRGYLASDVRNNVDELIRSATDLGIKLGS
ncbi:hypothetical protein [Sphingobacterium sp. UBA2074]|uniref:hypothetical protein n=1 Tax=Sphingobacterium sp. UBA2074 TaxID=1947487 RepID=UPI00257D56FD|nr:hypothetical protein [Sphingobacterium sp. UBA2074]